MYETLIKRYKECREQWKEEANRRKVTELRSEENVKKWGIAILIKFSFWVKLKEM